MDRPDIAGQGAVLVVGAQGQLGREMTRCLQSDNTGNPGCLPVDRDVLDITENGAVQAYCRAARPRAIINCAAYTDVDKAEKEAGKAFAVNKQGAKNLAEAAADLDIPLVHISTDYVFDGTKPGMYTEDDRPNPLGIYGQSKLAGEKAVFEVHDKSVVIRTGWLYSCHGTNFVKTILGAAEKRAYLRVVADQVGTPTYAAVLAEAIVQMLPVINKGYGHIFHYANEGVASWYDFAVATIAFSGISCTIEPVETSQYPTLAMRPAYSVLNKKKIKSAFGLSIPHWTDALKLCINRKP